MGNRVTELLRAKRRQVRHLALVLVLAVVLVNRIDFAQNTAETDLVRDAVRNAAVTCTARETGKIQLPIWIIAQACPKCK